MLEVKKTSKHKIRVKESIPPCKKPDPFYVYYDLVEWKKSSSGKKGDDNCTIPVSAKERAWVKAFYLSRLDD